MTLTVTSVPNQSFVLAVNERHLANLSSWQVFSIWHKSPSGKYVPGGKYLPSESLANCEGMLSKNSSRTFEIFPQNKYKIINYFNSHLYSHFVSLSPIIEIKLFWENFLPGLKPDLYLNLNQNSDLILNLIVILAKNMNYVSSI